ncbi:ABC transporter substrate-binding protein [Thermodesulfobacteriota bacterium]
MKKNTATKILIIFSACFLLLAFLAPSVFAAGTSKYGGTLRIAINLDAENMGYPPRLRRTNSQWNVTPCIENLLRTGDDGRPVPWLATGYKADPQAKTITLSLRKGVRFHDGTDFNANAVKWNLDKQVERKAGGTQSINSVDVIDDHTVQINLKLWDNSFITMLTHITGMIISPASYEKNGEDWALGHPVGTGPFSFVSWEKDKKSVFKKFPGYWQKGKPYVDKIEYAPIRDHMTRVMSLKAKEYDLAIRLPEQNLPKLEKEGFKVGRGPMGLGNVGMVPDSRDPKSPMADVRVRKALAYAVDTKAIVEKIYFGEAIHSNQWASPNHWGYNPDVVGYPYNLAKAKKLMAEAGYSKGFETTFYYTNTYLPMATALQAYLATINIKLNLVPLQAAASLKMNSRGGGWKGITRGYSTSRPDMAAAMQIMYTGGPKYFINMLIPEDFVEAVNNAVAAPDFETKRKYVHQAQKLWIDKYCTFIPVFIPINSVTTYPYVKDHNFYAYQNDAQWTPELVWMDK